MEKLFTENPLYSIQILIHLFIWKIKEMSMNFFLVKILTFTLTFKKSNKQIKVEISSSCKYSFCTENVSFIEILLHSFPPFFPPLIENDQANSLKKNKKLLNRELTNKLTKMCQTKTVPFY